MDGIYDNRVSAQMMIFVDIMPAIHVQSTQELILRQEQPTPELRKSLGRESFPSPID